VINRKSSNIGVDMARRFVVPEKKLPDIPAMMLATLEALEALGGIAGKKELDDKVVEMEKIPEDEQSVMMANGSAPRLNYYLAWARTYLKRGGAIKNLARGVWSLTELANKLASLKETKKIYEQVNQEERERRKEKQPSKKVIDEAVKVLEELQIVLSEDEEAENEDNSWRQNLLMNLKSMDPEAFERLAQRLLRAAGFVKVEVLGKPSDGGIDGVGVLQINLVSFRVYFQCKRHKGSVSASAIRDFRGSIDGRSDKGILITTATFTAQANDEATRDGAVPIDLIDGYRLCDLLKQYGIGVHTKIIEQVTVDETFFKQE
jgi:restriction system protein